MTRKKAIDALRARTASQKFDWSSTPGEMFHLERFKDHGVSLNDRTTVLVSTSHVELALEIAISTHFVELTPDENRALFVGVDRDAPLSNFGAKIRIGYALGVFQKMVSEDLKIIQAVRNLFAHSAEYIDFSDESVSSSLKWLHYPKYGFQYGEGVLAKAIDAELKTSKGSFVETCKFLTMELVIGSRKPNTPVRISDRSFYPRFSWD